MPKEAPKHTPKPPRATTARLPADLFDPLAPTAPEAPGRAPAPAPAPAAPPRGRRVTRSSALGPTGYRVGGRRPGADLRGAAPVRMTAYLAPDQVLRLRHEVLRRQRKGERADLSALMREAIEHTFPPSRR